MITEKEIVTKKFLVENFVTKRYLDEQLNIKFKEQKNDIIHEMRMMMHDTIEQIMENKHLA